MTIDNKKFALDEDQLDMVTGGTGGGIQVSGNSVNTSISMSACSIGGGSMDTELTHAGSSAGVSMRVGSIGGGSTVSAAAAESKFRSSALMGN